MQKQIQLKKRPTGLPTSDHFEFVEVPIEKPAMGEVLLQTIYISVDPYLRGRMNDTKSYISPFKLNDTISSGVIGKVVESQSDLFEVGDFVIGSLGWQEFSKIGRAHV